MIRRFHIKPIPPTILLAGLMVVLLLVIAWLIGRANSADPNITDFESCVAAGNPVVDTYPEQCLDGTRGYVRQHDQ